MRVNWGAFGGDGREWAKEWSGFGGDGYQGLLVWVVLLFIAFPPSLIILIASVDDLTLQLFD